MTKPFKNLKTKLSPQARKKVDKKLQALLEQMALQELRQEKGISQEHVAKMLGTRQANVSRLERRTDMHISTWRSHVEAMGGKLHIIARFPEGDIDINQFKEIK